METFIIEDEWTAILRKYSEVIIDLPLVGDVYRPLQPQENIHHPDYFEAKREVDKCTDNPAKFDGQLALGTAASRRETPDSTDSPDGNSLEGQRVMGNSPDLRFTVS